MAKIFPVKKKISNKTMMQNNNKYKNKFTEHTVKTIKVPLDKCRLRSREKYEEKRHLS